MSPVRFETTPPAASAARLDAFETQHGFTLPDSYRSFLLRQNGGRPEDNLRFFDSPAGRVDVSANLFFGINSGADHDDLAKQIQVMSGRFPAGIIPIADAPCGDMIALTVHCDQRGSVWFWAHEMEPPDDEPADFRNLALLASDFAEFLELLEPFDAQAYE